LSVAPFPVDREGAVAGASPSATRTTLSQLALSERMVGAPQTVARRSLGACRVMGSRRRTALSGFCLPSQRGAQEQRSYHLCESGDRPADQHATILGRSACAMPSGARRTRRGQTRAVQGAVVTRSLDSSVHGFRVGHDGLSMSERYSERDARGSCAEQSATGPVCVTGVRDRSSARARSSG
jgi:hypothetical protein